MEPMVSTQISDYKPNSAIVIQGIRKNKELGGEEKISIWWTKPHKISVELMFSSQVYKNKASFRPQVKWSSGEEKWNPYHKNFYHLAKGMAGRAPSPNTAFLPQNVFWKIQPTGSGRPLGWAGEAELLQWTRAVFGIPLLAKASGKWGEEQSGVLCTQWHQLHSFMCSFRSTVRL